MHKLCLTIAASLLLHHFASGQEQGAESILTTTKLIEAVRGRKLNQVLELLDAGANPVTPTEASNGYSALHVAASLGHVEILRSLLSFANADSRRGPDGRTVLMSAAEYNQVGAMEVLLKGGAMAEDVNATDERLNQTALHYAAYGGHAEAVKVLLARGADPDSASTLGYTPLHHAAFWGYVDVTLLLLRTGKVRVDAQDEKGQTPLFLATWNGHLKTVLALLKSGSADPEVPATGVLGWSSLHWAASIGRTDMVRLFVEEAGANPMLVNPNGESPLFLAAMYDRLDVVDYLIAQVRN